MEKMIGKLWRHGQHRTSETYQATLNSFRKFRDGVDVCFDDIDSKMFISYEYHLRAKGLAPNTISFYMKRLRAVYNNAVEDGYAENRNPFKKVFTSSEKTIKRAIPLKFVRKLKDLDLSYSPSKRFARDMFLFSFDTRGMAFVDMAYLRRGHIRDGRIRYVRRKTGQEIVIRVEPEMQRIIERYACGEHPYVFPILKSENPEKAYAEYRIALSYYNRLLKRLCNMAGIPQHLSFYTARHSWATAARNHQVPVSVISAGMGHTSERTTQIYLTMLENSVIDNANRGILESLRCVVSL